MDNLYFRDDLNLENPVKGVFANIKGEKVSKKTCPKCSGQGHTNMWGSCDSGRCWMCQAKGYNIFRVYTAKEMAPIIRAHKNKLASNIKNAQLYQEISFIRRMGENHKKYISNLAYKTKKINKKMNSNWVADIGDKLELNVTLNWCIKKDGDYGTYFIKELQDDAGNIFSHMGAPIKDKDGIYVKRGSRINLKFTVKDHSEFNGLKQTKIKNTRLV